MLRPLLQARLSFNTHFFRYSSTSSKTWASFGLRSEVVEALNEQQITKPTPIQQKAIPTLLSAASSHVIIADQTGTGMEKNYSRSM